ncbi:THO complex subunit 5, partial [Bulinus truncatus]
MSKEGKDDLEGRKKRLLKTEMPLQVSSDAKKLRPDINAKSQESWNIASEEDDALGRDPLVDLQSFKASCNFLKSAIRDIKSLKSSMPEAISNITAIRTDATIHFIHMKKLNRMAHFRCRKVRETTNEAKHKIDQCHLQLQNLLYEAMHLEKEIMKCMEFKSKDEEIELISVEEFYKDAPASITNAEVTKNDPHLQMLGRLEWELELRKKLAAKLAATKKNKEQLSQEIQSKQDYLETLQPKLSAILQATRPVQDYLSMPYNAIQEEHLMAQHLPQALYVLYMQTSAFKDACDNCLKVSIVGDVDAAKSLSFSHSELDDDSDSDQEDQEKNETKHHRRMSDERNQEKKNRILRKHPLSVLLTITNEDDTELQLTFCYLIELNVITVTVNVVLSEKNTFSSVTGGDLLSPDLILDELYPGDFGLESPNPANHYELKKHGLLDLSTYIPQIGRPYLWCQWMGGLQFLRKDIRPVEDVESLATLSRLPVQAKHSICAANIQKTISLLRQRIVSRISLLQQLSSIERGIIPVSADFVKLFPAKINAHLSSWTRCTFEDFQALPHAKRFLRSGLIRSSNVVFVAVIDRGSAKMTAHAVLTADYPQVPPLFILDIFWQSRRTALSDIYVMEMEEEVNLHYGELISSKQQYQLLSNQIQRLLMCFDVYLETDTPASTLVPVEIPKEKIMPRTSRWVTVEIYA